MVTADTAEDDRTVDMAPVRAPVSRPPSSRRKRILVVEPNDHRRFARAEALRERHSVATAPGMGGALRLLSSETFDIVLVAEDLGADAFALLEAVAIMWPETRRCVLASVAPTRPADALAMQRAQRVYTSPFDVEAFLHDLARRFAPTLDLFRDD